MVMIGLRVDVRKFVGFGSPEDVQVVVVFRGNLRAEGVESIGRSSLAFAVRRVVSESEGLVSSIPYLMLSILVSIGKVAALTKRIEEALVRRESAGVQKCGRGGP